MRRPASKLPPSELKATKAEDKDAALAANWSSSNAARDPSTTTTLGRSGVCSLTVITAATAGVVTSRIDAIEMRRRMHPRVVKVTVAGKSVILSYCHMFGRLQVGQMRNVSYRPPRCFALSLRHRLIHRAVPRMKMSNWRDHGTGRRFSVTLLRRHTVHLPAPVVGNRNADAICGIRPATG